MRKTGKNLKSITGDDIPVYGSVKLEIKLYKNIYTIHAIVVGDECSFIGNLLLGCDRMSTLLLKLDFRNNRLFQYEASRKREIPLKVCYKPSIVTQLIN